MKARNQGIHESPHEKIEKIQDFLKFCEAAPFYLNLSDERFYYTDADSKSKILNNIL